MSDLLPRSGRPFGGRTRRAGLPIWAAVDGVLDAVDVAADVVAELTGIRAVIGRSSSGPTPPGA